jgi:hypothetical protein
MTLRAAVALVTAMATLGGGAARADIIVNLNPTADAFVRSPAPTGNYGGAGALSVSGASAVNGSGFQGGLFDSYLRFDVSGLRLSADTAYGAGNWTVLSANLRLTETAAPANTNFNRGTGSFEVRWLANDAWVEGTGSPSAPTTDGIAYGDRSTYFTPLSDSSLGMFTNARANVAQSFALGLDGNFLADITAGDLVSLYLEAGSDSIGFTFNSRSFGTASARPFLDLTVSVIPEPSTFSLLAAAALGLWHMRTRRHAARA